MNLSPSSLIYNDSSHQGYIVSWAIKYNQTALLDYFYKLIVKQYKTDDVNEKGKHDLPRLAWAVALNQSDQIDHLISLSADVNLKNPLSIACSQGNTKVAKKLLKANAEKTPHALIFAVDEAKSDIVKLLIDEKIDVNQRSTWPNFPLYTAFFALNYYRTNYSEIIKIVELLLEAGADVNAVDGLAKETVLHVAVRDKRHPKFIRTLYR